MTEQQMDARPGSGAGASREVSFYPVYQLLSPLLGDPSLIPGTPVWAALDDTDPVKWQAILWAAVWWAVAEDARQEAIDEAGEEISAAEDWALASRRFLRRREIDAMRRAS